MHELLMWLIAVGAGVLFGFFPTWWWCAALIVEAAEIQNRSVPNWMINLAWNNPGLGLLNPVLYKKRWYPVVLRIFGAAWVSVCLAGIHYLIIKNYAIGGVVDVIKEETSFTLFLLLTWLLPPWFLRRLLRKLAEKNTTLANETHHIE